MVCTRAYFIGLSSLFLILEGLSRDNFFSDNLVPGGLFRSIRDTGSGSLGSKEPACPTIDRVGH